MNTMNTITATNTNTNCNRPILGAVRGIEIRGKKDCAPMLEDRAMRKVFAVAEYIQAPAISVNPSNIWIVTGMRHDKTSSQGQALLKAGFVFAVSKKNGPAYFRGTKNLNKIELTPECEKLYNAPAYEKNEPVGKEITPRQKEMGALERGKKYSTADIKITPKKSEKILDKMPLRYERLSLDEKKAELSRIEKTVQMHERCAEKNKRNAEKLSVAIKHDEEQSKKPMPAKEPAKNERKDQIDAFIKSLSDEEKLAILEKMLG